ncbi:DUF1942 domain-containing protein [Mycolicibacterium mucogenicum]|jgi:hypothetical protein|uniref:DUF1942 domain-containing protein n=1 Tax=Mycolicibacterium TaxID=1866885 RepID=UPI000A5F058D
MAMVRAIRQLIMTAVALIAVMTIGSPLAAAAMKCPHQLGAQQQLTDASGAATAEWTLTDLRPSTDAAPGYPLAGRLWEATVTVRAASGAVTPVIPNFSAMGARHTQYPVLWQLATPTGISPATLAEGQSATGKIYFDATGPDPMVVAYTTGGSKPAMMWCNMAAMAPMMSKSMSMPMSMDDCPCCDAGCPSCPERR